MKKNLALLLAVIIFASLLSGCWSKRELNELALISAIGIDKSDNGYLLTVQIINPGEIAGEKATGSRVPVLTYRTTGKTLFEALRRLSVEAPRRIYMAHTRVVVLGEELARNGITDVLDFLARDHELRTDFYILIAKGRKAEAVLRMLTVLEDIPANKIFSSLETSAKVWAATNTIKLDELISNIVGKGINPAIPGILISGNTEIGESMENLQRAEIPTLLKIGTVGAFKKDKLVGWLGEVESIGYNAIMGKIKGSVTTLSLPEGGKLTVEVMRTEAKIKSKMVDGKPGIEVEYRSEGNVGEVQGDIDLTKPESISKIEDMWRAQAEKTIRETIKRAQEDFESDIFGFGEAFHRQNPKVWKSLQKNWEEEFTNMHVDVKAIVKIRRIGTITSPIGKEKE